MDFSIILAILISNVLIAWGFLGVIYVLNRITYIEREQYKWSRFGTGLRVFTWGPFVWGLLLGCLATNLYVAARRGWRERGNFFVGKKM